MLSAASNLASTRATAPILRLGAARLSPRRLPGLSVTGLSVPGARTAAKSAPLDYGPQRTLWMSGVPKDVPLEEIKQLLGPAAKEVTVGRNPLHDIGNRMKYVYVDYESQAAAQAAVHKQLLQPIVLHGVIPTLAFAHRQHRMRASDPLAGTPSSTLHLSALDGETSRADIAEALGVPIAWVEKPELSRRSVTATVTYPSVEEATAALRRTVEKPLWVCGARALIFYKAPPLPPTRALYLANFRGDFAELRQLLKPFSPWPDKAETKSLVGFADVATATKARDALNGHVTRTGHEIKLDYAKLSPEAEESFFRVRGNFRARADAHTTPTEYAQRT